jgi:P4 family phage/plasmid primase-like protien
MVLILCLRRSNHPKREYYNTWADFWRQVIGVNVIPADTRAKKTHIKWSQYQNNPVSEAQHDDWKTGGAFLKGMAVIAGKVWHRPDKTGRYFTIVDLDKANGIEELCTTSGETISLDILAQKFLVEQHKDNLEKAHVYFYSPIAFPQKSFDSKLGIEVKGLGEHGITYCACSIHQSKNPQDRIEHRYEIYGVPNAPITLSLKQSVEMIQHIDRICTMHGINYLKKDNRISRLKPMIKSLILDPTIKISEGERHLTLLSTADSILLMHRDKGITEENLKTFFMKMNRTLCIPFPLPDWEVEEIWNSAIEFTNRISGDRWATKEKEKEEDETKLNRFTKVGNYTEELIRRHKFVTIEETMEIRYYDHGVYLPNGEQLIRKELEEIGGYDININTRREIVEHIRNKKIIALSEFDKDLNITNVKNGLYKVLEDELHEHTPEYLSLIQKTITYNRGARSELFEKFVNEVVYPDDVRTLKESMAYTFYRDNPFEYYFIRLGKGGNGKGVCDKILIALHGWQSVSNIKLQTLLDNRFAKFHLIGKDINIDPEITSGRIQDLAVLKELTGQIPIFVESKGKDGHEVNLHAKPFFSANELPPIEDVTNARYRREIIISFPNTYELIPKEQQQGLNFESDEVRKADPHLGEKLTTQEELSGIFNILMDSLRTVLKNEGIHLKQWSREEQRAK